MVEICHENDYWSYLDKHIFGGQNRKLSEEYGLTWRVMKNEID